jgi:hypothetical protein
VIGGCQVAMSGESLIDACSLFVVRASAVGSSIPLVILLPIGYMLSTIDLLLYPVPVHTLLYNP